MSLPKIGEYELHVGVQMSSGKTSIIPHGLGKPYRYWWFRAADPGSSPFQAMEARPTSITSVDRYLSLIASCDGTYDIVVALDERDG